MADCKQSVELTGSTNCPPPASGIYEPLYVFNYDEVSFATVSSGGVTASFTMSGSATVYKMNTHREGGDYKATLADNDDGGSEYTHRVEGRVLDLNAGTGSPYPFFKEAIGAKVIVVVLTKAGPLKVLGLEGGLYLKEHEESATSGAVGHKFAFVGDKQPNQPVVFLHTDRATSIADLETART